MKLRILIVFYFILCSASGSRIFAAFPIPSVSHQNVFVSLLEALARRGHEVTALLTNPSKINLSNFDQIDVGEESYRILNRFLDDNNLLSSRKGMVTTFLKIFDFQLSHERIQRLLKDGNTTFDVCFFEGTAHVMLGFKDVFKCPTILMTSLTSPHFNLDAFGVPTNPGLYPCVMTPYAGHFSLFQRLHSIYLRIQYFLESFGMYEDFNKLVRKHFGKDARPVEEVMEDADMLFMGSHELFSIVRPVVPAVIYVGGLHIKETKQLPEKLLKILDAGTEGVIYCSLGSTLNFDIVDKRTRRDFIKALGELPYKVVLKWKGDKALIVHHHNIFTFEWLPQQDLLAHKNIKVFITHGGPQSIEEAIHHGVPMVAMGLHADGFQNAEKIELHQIGKRLDRKILTKNYIKNTILQVATNETYRKNVIRLRELIYDQPQTSMEKAIWWTEYVIRNKGSKHLKPLKVSFYREHFLDVLILFLIIIITGYFTAVSVINRIKRKQKCD